MENGIHYRICHLREAMNAVGAYMGNPNVHNHGALFATLPLIKALGTQNRFSATSNDQLAQRCGSHSPRQSALHA